MAAKTLGIKYRNMKWNIVKMQEKLLLFVDVVERCQNGNSGSAEKLGIFFSFVQKI